MVSRCVSRNLGPKARRAQLRIGVLGLTFALVAGLVLVELGLANRLGWVLLLPLAFGSYSLLAGLTGVCAFSGARGARYADHGMEHVADCSLRKQLRNKGFGVAMLSLLCGVLGAAVFVASV